jgi:hypothetical protein
VALTFTISRKDFDEQVAFIRQYAEECANDLSADMDADDLNNVIGLRAEVLFDDAYWRMVPLLHKAVKDLLE